jgi:ATP-dependent helicase/nuclease subunit B
VPSFYPLEAVRAAEGRLPDFAELARRAATVTTARFGWPAPPDPIDAIDNAEHDLVILDRLTAMPEASAGAARYLVTANDTSTEVEAAASGFFCGDGACE